VIKDGTLVENRLADRVAGALRNRSPRVAAAGARRRACGLLERGFRSSSPIANSYNAETLERCLAVQPDDVETMKDLGLMYESATKWDRAEAVYRRALAIDPEDGDTRVRLGGLLLRRGDLAGARREAEAALKVQPGSVAALQLFHRASGVEKGVR
jgi:tetratricopeptide (TPR) repeat protein